MAITQRPIRQVFHDQKRRVTDAEIRDANDSGMVKASQRLRLLEKARQFAQSSDLREVMQQAGVVDQPDVYFLEALEEVPV